MSSAVRYSGLFKLNGAKSFCAAAAIARLPMVMMNLGIVLAINHVYNNWSIAGIMSASYILAAAVVTPFYARLFDRFGQKKVGKGLLALQLVFMLIFALAVLFRINVFALIVLVTLMGLTQFSFGALVRTRWSYALYAAHKQELLNSAYALEAAIDEVLWLLGPVLAAYLATSVHPVSQLFVPIISCAIGGSIFFSLKNSQPIIEPTAIIPKHHKVPKFLKKTRHSTHISLETLHVEQYEQKVNVLGYRGIAVLIALFMLLNSSFTFFDVALTALLKAHHLEAWVGLQLGMFAVGSCVGALIFGSKAIRGSQWLYMMIFLIILGTGYVGIRLSMNNYVVIGIIEMISGVVVAPTFTLGNLLVKSIVPSRSLTEGLAWIQTASAVGGALGAAGGGVIIDRIGADVALLFPFLVTYGAAICAFIGAKIVKSPTNVPDNPLKVD